MTAQNSFSNPVEQQAMLDFVARMQDPQQALEDARLEDEANCTIGAGADLGAHLGALMANPQEFYQHQRIRSLVMRELRQFLEECNLGAGLPDAIKVGQQLLSKRLRQPAEEIQQQLSDTRCDLRRSFRTGLGRGLVGSGDRYSAKP